MIIDTTTSLPPEISCIFSSMLLSYPAKLRDDETDIWNMWTYIEGKLWKKLDKCPNRKQECEALKKEFFQVYERIKAKKKNGETKAKNKTEEPFYFLECSSRSDSEILQRLRYRKIRNRSYRANL